MNTRERFQAVMNFRPFDRLPVIEWATWWTQTIERWEAEGLPAGMDNYGIMCYFGLDLHHQDWIGPRSPQCPAPSGHGRPIISTAGDYDRLRPHLFNFPETGDGRPVVDPAKWESWAKDQATGDTVLWFTLEGFFWLPRVLFGIEPHLYAFYDHPELMHRINEDNAAWMQKVIGKICEYCTPDFMTFAEDMSYNHGPMIGRDLFDEFMRPYYEAVLPELKKRGVKAIIDSDGDIHDAAGWFEAAGLDGILPLERQAGVDMERLRREHPGQIYLGAFDKMAMNRGEAAMRAEFERLLPTASRGGFIISCDHQTPPGVSLENYRLYLKLFREYAAAARKYNCPKV
ncbi:MAG: uroporphyrinogen decarboxylase family protein [Victivallales bacterium]|nr:uroporphyrinogen decarboxylase family protein [Victivallales bacterium]